MADGAAYLSQDTVVITAFEARPNVGTEAGLAWNWAMAYQRRGYRVQVVTAQVPDHITEGDDKLWTDNQVDIVRTGPPLNKVGAASGIKSMFQMSRSYQEWIKSAREYLKEIDAQVIHHVSWGSIRLAPPFSFKNTTAICVWGPLGGGQHAYFRGLRLRDWPPEIARTISFGYFLERTKKQLKKIEPDVITLVTNNETGAVARGLGLTPIHMLADGINDSTISVSPRELRSQSELRLVWAGRLVPTKRPDIAVMTIAALLKRGINAQLVICGDGPCKDELIELISNEQLDAHVALKGKVPFPDMASIYAESDVLLFHSMRDSSCPAVLEAASKGIPTVALRIQGVKACFSSSVARGPENVARARDLAPLLADYCMTLLDKREYSFASRCAIQMAKRATWDTKLDEIFSYFEAVQGAS